MLRLLELLSPRMLVYIIFSFLLLLIVNALPSTSQIQSHVTTIIHTPFLNTSSNSAVHCDPMGRGTFSRQSCIQNLIQIRALPDWDKTQVFLEDVRPEIYPGNPHFYPPFAFVSPDDTCVLILRARRSDIQDAFSWEEVSSLAYKIIQDCPVNGGFSYIGAKTRWMVSVSDAVPALSRVGNGNFLVDVV